jgi:hypothetical protein
MQTAKKFLRLIIHQVKLQFMCMDISCILVRAGWVLFFLIGCHHLANSQSNQTMFNQTVDYVNCEFAKQSLKEYNEAIHQKYLQEFPNCSGTDSDFAADLLAFLKVNKVTGTYDLANAINGFKQKYKTEFTPGDEVDEEDIYNLVKRDIFNIPKVKSFENNHKSTFPFLRTNIVKQLQMQLVPNQLITNNNLISEPSADNEYIQSDDGYEYEEMIEEDRNQNRFVSQNYEENGIISRRDILWLFSLLMFGLLAFYFIRSVMPRYTVNQSYQSIQIDDDKTKNLLEQLSKKVKDLRKEHNELIEELEVLNHRFSNLDRTTDIKKTAIETIQENIEHSLSEDEEEAKLEEIPIFLEDFYLPIPNQDGSFNAEDALAEFKRTETAYQFKIVSREPLRAEFKIYEDVATMLRALDDPDIHLKPACRSNAIIPISATKILTDESGLAVFRNNEWKVVKKALIHYV